MDERRKIEGIHEEVVVEGTDAQSFLDGLLTQDLEHLDPERPMRSFLLTPQGKLRALLWVRGVPERISLVTDSGVGKQVADDLEHYKIRVKATISEPAPVITILEGDSDVRFSSEPIDYPDLSIEEWEAIRIERGEPVMGVDVDESTIPQETGLVDEAVSFTKGCFLGQELVARLDSRGGRVNRHLRRVRLESLPATPAPVNEGEGGRVTSAFATAQGALGLGLLHRTIEPGDSIEVDGISATVL